MAVLKRLKPKAAEKDVASAKPSEPPAAKPAWMKYFSYSKIRTWRNCHKAFDYKYRQGLTKKAPAQQLIKGSMFHECIDAYVLGLPWHPIIEKYREKYMELWDEEKDRYGSPEDVQSLFERYLKKYSNDPLEYLEVNGRRSEIEILVELEGVPVLAIIDKIPKDKESRIWVEDHKTHKVLPDEDARFSDLQTVLYYRVVQEAGINADGVLWDYIRTKPPAVPEKLVKGGLSRRANIDTDVETYRQAVLDAGYKPEDYQDMLTKPSIVNNVFFKRVFLPAPSKDLVSSVTKDFLSTAKEIMNSDSAVRTMTKDCKRCDYYQICSAEVRGLDSEFIKRNSYQLKELK